MKTKTTRHVALLFAVGMSAFLIGCQGQNPFNRQSDPVKDYPLVNATATKAYVPGSKDTPVTMPDNDQSACFEAFKVSVEPDYGNLLMKFTENENSDYTVTVRSMQTAKFEVTPTLPKGANLNQVSRTAKTITYKFSWKPAKGQSQQVPADKFVLTYSSAFNQTNCQSNNIPVPLNLVVSTTKDVPTVSFQDVPSKLTFGQAFDFKVIIDDPAATADKTAAIDQITFISAVTSGERVNLNAKGAVDCEAQGQVTDDLKSVFSCHFESGKVAGVDKYLNSGKEVGAIFHIIAKSTRSNQPSSPTPQRVTLVFEKQIAAKTAQVDGVKK